MAGTKNCLLCKKTFELKYKGNKFCSLACSNRFNLNNKNTKVRTPKEPSINLAELFGILLGDGSVVQYFVKVYLNASCEYNYSLYVQRLCKNLFPGATVSRYLRKARGTIEIQISSSEVSKFLLRNGFDPKRRSVPEWIQKNEAHVEASLRGLFDTEGTVGVKYFDGKNGVRFYKQLTFTNKNENLLKFVETQLKKRGYKPTAGSKKNIYISNGNDIGRYAREIGSSNSKLTKKLKARVLGSYAYGGVG